MMRPVILLLSTIALSTNAFFLPSARRVSTFIPEHISTASPTTTKLQMGLDLVDPSYNLAIGAFSVGLTGGFLEDLRDKNGEKLLTAKPFGALALLFTLFAGFLAFQTTTLRFGFDDDSFSLVKSNGSSMGENVVVGGENKWAYSSFQNYDFLPSSNFPILVYFREDQTPVGNREEVPIVVDNLDGQVHFFPAISNVKQLEEGFAKHGCSHIE
mmetsp:Transcript_5968/g.8861  ORF Transcript_5968/g.8861 Transcript_5968/m.8861 type:complete len:213 (-) Transcript_5968:7-645(-)